MHFKSTNVKWTWGGGLGHTFPSLTQFKTLSSPDSSADFSNMIWEVSTECFGQLHNLKKKIKQGCEVVAYISICSDLSGRRKDLFLFRLCS